MVRANSETRSKMTVAGVPKDSFELRPNGFLSDALDFAIGEVADAKNLGRHLDNLVLLDFYPFREPQRIDQHVGKVQIAHPHGERDCACAQPRGSSSGKVRPQRQVPSAAMA